MTASSCTSAVRWARDIEPPILVSRLRQNNLNRSPAVCFFGNAHELFDVRLGHLSMRGKISSLGNRDLWSICHRSHQRRGNMTCGAAGGRATLGGCGHGEVAMTYVLISHQNTQRLGQRLLVPHLLQVDGDERPSQGLPPLWRLKPDLERDRDGR